MYVLACTGVLGISPCKFRNSGRYSPEHSTCALERCMEFGIRVVPLPCPLEDEAAWVQAPRTGCAEAEFRDEGNERLQNTGIAHSKGIDRGIPICIILGQVSQVAQNRNGCHSICNELPYCLSPTVFPGIPVTDAATFSRYRIYLAAPLFSEAERRFNRKLAAVLARHNLTVYLPQDAGDDTPGRDTGEHQEIFLANLTALQKSHLVIAVVDGADADSGTAWEMGYAFASKIPVIALRTDFRMVGGQEHVNLMLEQSAAVVQSCKDLVEVLTYKKPFPICIPHLKVPGDESL
jgi:nucleoside 2-deoxyribosyltransferase